VLGLAEKSRVSHHKEIFTRRGEDRMNKRFLISPAPLLIIAAFAVIPAVAQAGPPELGRCLKVVGGSGPKYKDAGCEKGVVSTGKYEWFPGAILSRFTSKEGKSTIETVGKVRIICTADTDSGAYTGPKTDIESITFTGCTFTGLGLKASCQTSTSNAPGEIVTNPLTSVLGFIKKPSTIGMSLEGPGGVFAEFTCGPYRIVISGSVIAQITPVSKMTITFKEKFVATKGLQKPEQFEGEPKDTLLCSVIEAASGVLLASEQCGFTSADIVTNEELLEVNEVL